MEVIRDGVISLYHSFERIDSILGEVLFQSRIFLKISRKFYVNHLFFTLPGATAKRLPSTL